MKYFKTKSFISIACLFFLFLFFFHRHTINSANQELVKHSEIIAESVWVFDSKGSDKYLRETALKNHYESLIVRDMKGNIITEIKLIEMNSFEKLLILIKMIPRVKLSQDIHMNNERIGKIEIVWLNKSVYIYVYALILCILIVAIIQLYGRILNAKLTLEEKVKEKTKDLKQSEKKYRELIDNAPDLRYRTDNEGRIVFVSQSAYKLSGYTVKETTGLKMADEIYVHPEQRDTFLEILQEKGFINDFEAQLKRKDGSIWWASTNAQFYKDKEGNILGVEGVSRDVTDKKLAEEERKKLETQLRQSHKMEAIGTIAGGIAHDFNNILGIIIGNMELAIDSIEDWNPARLNLEEIKKASLRASDVVKQLLNFSRKTEQSKKILDIHPLIKESIKLIRSSVPTTIDIQLNTQDIKGVIIPPGHSNILCNITIFV